MKTILAPNAPWPKVEPKPAPKPKAPPKPKISARSKIARTDENFFNWKQKNGVVIK